MVLTKDELISAVKNECRIFVHLCSKVDKGKVDYRPTPKQRSTIELARYMTCMAPALIRSAKAGAFDMEAWQKAQAVAEAMDFDAAVAAMGKQGDECAALLAGYSDADFRGEIEMFGSKATRGAFLVNFVLGGYAAYRTQLFCYLKSCGREELNTMNLWGGMDAAATA